jgi:hypothetical protein
MIPYHDQYKEQEGEEEEEEEDVYVDDLDEGDDNES